MATSLQGRSPSERLEIDAEIQRVAKLLGVARTELEYLYELSAGELRELRNQITATLFDNQGILKRLASASRLLPASLVANLAEKSFGPMLGARIAGMVDPDHAVQIASRLSLPFLADLAGELDPRSVATILGKIPPATIAAVTAQLVAREDWISLGAFYGYIPDASISAAMAETDAHAMLHISLVLDDKSCLSHVIDIAGPERLSEVAVAAEAEGLGEQLRALSVYLTPEQQAKLPG